MNKMNSTVDKCPICTSTTTLKDDNFSAYHQKGSYSIFYCFSCNTSYTLPRIPDNDLYERIYKDARNIGGYSRYVEYADNILKQNDPLNYLAHESVYWAIETVLNRFAVENQTNILDVGSGLGYLTYAIRKRGYQVTGLDISNEAVMSASQKYGNYFVCADLADYSKTHHNSYDIVILAEVIEHLPDIITFLTLLKSLIKRNGKIIITTHNKSVYESDVIWDTDLPPVHFWWLSEDSLRAIAQKLDLNIELVDFTPYNKKHNRGMTKLKGNSGQHRPVFDLDYNIISHPKVARDIALENLIRRTGILDFGRFVRRQQRKLRLVLSSQPVCNQHGSSLCAILTQR